MLLNKFESDVCASCETRYISQPEDALEWTCNRCDLKNHQYEFFCALCDNMKNSACQLSEPQHVLKEKCVRHQKPRQKSKAKS
jgi:hypothetical protein